MNEFNIEYEDMESGEQNAIYDVGEVQALEIIQDLLIRGMEIHVYPKV